MAIVLGAGLGLRQGEASGSTADRIDGLRDRSVRIDRQWSSRRLPQGFAPLESESSYRTVPAADDVLAELGRVSGGRDGFVLNRGGDPVSLQPGLRFHALRHRFASVLLSGGCSIVAAPRSVGLSSTAITLGIHGHLVPSDTDRIRAALAGQVRRHCWPDLSS